MEELILLQQQLLEDLSSYKRYLLDKIDWSNRLIGIKGARGVGKTTLLLQQIQTGLNQYNSESEYLYVSMDNLYFTENTLVSLAKDFVLKGGTHLFLDEVHKYPNWSREIKLLYDQHKTLNIVFTSSSILELYKDEADLSRRLVSYNLKELSFREFLYFETKKKYKYYTLEEIINNHKEIARDISTDEPGIIKYFNDYLQYGAYPYFIENKKSYIQKLQKTIDLIIEIDLNAVENITYYNGLKIKKLLVAIAQSVPFTPNIKKLSERLGVQRAFLLKAIGILHRAELITELYSATKGIGAFTKPEKLYLNNTNLMYALDKNNIVVGTIRETFFANQMKHLHETHLAPKGDFLIDSTYTFEIGGKNKSSSQIQGIENGYVVRDDIKIGSLNIIPLHLFGFLY